MAVLNKRAIVMAIEMYGVTAIRLGRTLNPALDVLIKALFTSGEQGFAYDPNDLTTLYQDAAGTIPVTSVGQPVGLILDKSKGLRVGNELWDDSNVVFGGEATRLGVNRYHLKSTGGAYSGFSCANPVDLRRVFVVVEFTIESISGGLVGTAILRHNGSSTLGKNRIIGTSGTAAMNFKRIGSGDAVISDISVKVIYGNHAYQTVSASRPILQRNATTGAYYLAFDGVDDSLQTDNIDFTATDKVSLFAGVRKLSDAASAIVAELSPSSATNNGSFHLAAPDSVSGNNYQLASRGTVRSIPTTPTTYISPTSNVVTVAGEIASNTAKIRVDGAQVAQSTAAQGTGNFGNYPLFIGRRGGTSLPFNGHLYSLIGIGRLTTDSETITLEKSIAKNTGVTLNV